MGKPLSFVLLCLCAILAASLYGALHNQISYTIGASYFYDVKFDQFGVDPALRGRIGASLVGVLASWWMGLAMALPAFSLGLLWIPTAPAYLGAGLTAITAATSVTLLFAFAGLGFAMITDINTLVARLPFLDAFSDPIGFARAAIMHDASYIGGATGALTALWIMWRARPRLPKQG